MERYEASRGTTGRPTHNNFIFHQVSEGSPGSLLFPVLSDRITFDGGMLGSRAGACVADGAAVAAGALGDAALLCKTGAASICSGDSYVLVGA
jgi:hypothetical protein